LRARAFITNTRSEAGDTASTTFPFKYLSATANMLRKSTMSPTVGWQFVLTLRKIHAAGVVTRETTQGATRFSWLPKSSELTPPHFVLSIQSVRYGGARRI
jgi:hypothetical protein